jgi:hypothetical protein
MYQKAPYIYITIKKFSILLRLLPVVRNNWECLKSCFQRTKLNINPSEKMSGPMLTLGKDRTQGVSVFDVAANPKLLEQLVDMGFERSVRLYYCLPNLRLV